QSPDRVVARRLPDLDIAKIDRLQIQLRIVGNPNVEIENYAVAVIAVSAVINAIVRRSERPVFIQPDEVALLRQVELHIALRLLRSLVRIRMDLLDYRDLHLRTAIPGYVDETADIIHQHLFRVRSVRHVECL